MTAHHDPAFKAVVVQEARKGSTREVAAEFGISNATVSRWVKEAAGSARAAPAAPPSAPPDDDAPELSTLESLKEALQTFLRAERDYRLAGDLRQAASMAGHATRIAPAVARLEREANADPDALQFSRAEIVAGEEALRDRIRIMCERPLLCAHCSRELSVFWGERVNPGIRGESASVGPDDTHK